MENIGTLSEVSIKDMWDDERTFSNWLAEHVDMLGKALGMKPVEVQREVSVGPLFADLIFRDESTEGTVVVENMLDKTDHRHLGQLVTYAAGLDAACAVLISKEFGDEHRSAIMWLNDISKDVAFFGVVLEGWRIDESLPAPRLRVEVKPDEWRRLVSATQDGTWSERQILYYEFWSKFLPEFTEQYPDWGQRRTPQNESSMYFKLPRELMVSVAFPANGQLRVYMYCTKEQFDHFQEQRDQIEERFGGSLKWDRADHQKQSVITAYPPDKVDFSEKEKWPEAREWLIDAAGRMRQAFIKDLPR